MMRVRIKRPLRAGLVPVLLIGSLAAAAVATDQPKVLVIGFDGMDPLLLSDFRAQGILPTFDRFIAAGDFRELGTAIPPQSPVAWSNFSTGQDPGGHGIFDFIHRDPETMLPVFSASQALGPQRFWRVGTWKIPREDGEVKNLRQGSAFWEYLADADIDVTIFKIPSNFPPTVAEVRSLSGMGTPDILGTYGIFSYLTDDPPAGTDFSSGRLVIVSPRDGRIETELLGPHNIFREGDPQSAVPVTVVIDPEHPVARFDIGGREFVLEEGEWSDWLRLDFPLIPVVKSVSGICRVYLMETRPHFRLYVTPIQIDPLEPAMPISTPSGYSAELARENGLFYTQGLPDDTKALESGVFSDGDYVGQSDLVLAERLRQFEYELDRFAGLESGLLFFYFNSPDQCCHVIWRNMDPHSPTHAASDPEHRHRIRDKYVALDGALATALDRLGNDTTILVMSDHGFAPFYRAFHVNTWLLENGYLHLLPDVAPGDVEVLQGVDWSRTRAYAYGINGLYLNQRGREAQGIVAPGTEREELLAELVTRLEQVRDPVGDHPAIKYAYRTDEVYHGPHRDGGPDLVLGYHRGWRGSDASALGEIPAAIFEDNPLKWSGDHCMAADEVPGVLLANREINAAAPNLIDLAPTLLRLFGVAPPPEMVGEDIFAPRGHKEARRVR